MSTLPSNESNGPNDRYRKVENHPWELLPCRLCGFSAELWQRWVRDDIWCSFGACSNLEDVDGEACIFHLPDSGHFYCERKSEAVRYWNLMMGPRGSNETSERQEMVVLRPCAIHQGMTFFATVGYRPPLREVCPGCEKWPPEVTSEKANVVVVGPTCGKDTPDGPCRSDIGHEGDCDGLPY